MAKPNIDNNYIITVGHHIIPLKNSTYSTVFIEVFYYIEVYFYYRFLNFIFHRVAGCYLITFVTAFAEISHMEAT